MPAGFKIRSQDVRRINELLGTSYSPSDFVQLEPREVRSVIDALTDIFDAEGLLDGDVTRRAALADDMAAALRFQLISLYGHAAADGLVNAASLRRKIIRTAQDIAERSGYYRVELTTHDGRRVAKDLAAIQTDALGKPAEPPPGAKPYHGFPLLPETCIDGWCFGAVTDYAEPDSAGGCTIGDGFVEAPDGTRAGVFWEYRDKMQYKMVVKPDSERWGVYYFTVPSPVRSLDDLKKNFSRMLPTLKRLHRQHSQNYPSKVQRWIHTLRFW